MRQMQFNQFKFKSFAKMNSNSGEDHESMEFSASKPFKFLFICEKYGKLIHIQIFINNKYKNLLK